jgi:hypothetical protein
MTRRRKELKRGFRRHRHGPKDDAESPSSAPGLEAAQAHRKETTYRSGINGSGVRERSDVVSEKERIFRRITKKGRGGNSPRPSQSHESKVWLPGMESHLYKLLRRSCCMAGRGRNNSSPFADR